LWKTLSAPLVMHYVATDDFCNLKNCLEYFNKFFKVQLPFYSGHSVFAVRGMKFTGGWRKFRGKLSVIYLLLQTLLG
jgi:hypothetical protein